MWIRTWTDHTWPISLQEAFAIRDSLGWIPSPQEPRYFTTKLSTSGKEDGIILESNEFGVKGVRFNLSSIYSPDDNEGVIHGGLFVSLVGASAVSGENWVTILDSHGETADALSVYHGAVR